MRFTLQFKPMNKLTANHFSFKCPMNWDEMDTTANGRFCGKCRKEVYDHTNCTIDEVIALQQKHGSICGSIKVAQVAVVAAALSSAACQSRTTGAPYPPTGPEEKVVFQATGGVIMSPEDLKKSNCPPDAEKPVY